MENSIKNKKLITVVMVVIFGLLLTIAAIYFVASRDEQGEVIFFDVGQGDSIYIEVKENFQVLIDGGPDATILEKLSAEMPFYDRKIELIVLTHPDRDHLFGLLEVLRSYKVNNVLWTGVVKDTAEYDEWLKLIKEEGSNVIMAKAGQKIVLQKSPDVYLDILSPLESVEGKTASNINDTSVVAKLIFGKTSFLLAGDISGKIEKELAGSYLKADVLKIAHHGSKYSSTLEFIEAVSPESAVISVGENNWGHPAEEVLQRLKQFGIQILITKELGDIKLSF